ncbi:unnamed protein product, partial [Allacma fusca]
NFVPQPDYPEFCDDYNFSHVGDVAHELAAEQGDALNNVVFPQPNEVVIPVEPVMVNIPIPVEPEVVNVNIPLERNANDPVLIPVEPLVANRFVPVPIEPTTASRSIPVTVEPHVANRSIPIPVVPIEPPVVNVNVPIEPIPANIPVPIPAVVPVPAPVARSSPPRNAPRVPVSSKGSISSRTSGRMDACIDFSDDSMDDVMDIDSLYDESVLGSPDLDPSISDSYLLPDQSDKISDYTPPRTGAEAPIINLKMPEISPDAKSDSIPEGPNWFNFGAPFAGPPKDYAQWWKDVHLPPRQCINICHAYEHYVKPEGVEVFYRRFPLLYFGDVRLVKDYPPIRFPKSRYLNVPERMPSAEEMIDGRVPNEQVHYWHTMMKYIFENQIKRQFLAVVTPGTIRKPYHPRRRYGKIGRDGSRPAQPDPDFRARTGASNPVSSVPVIKCDPKPITKPRINKPMKCRITNF